VKQAAVSVSSETVLVAASSKYGTFGKYKALDVADVDVVVSDAGLSDATVTGIGALGVRVLRA
jgi:DeoR/GlpR family transcriptional regulator of sugar metabolism